jgi:protein gp37
MMAGGRSTIEWLRNAQGRPGRTWNTVDGCDPASEGCDNCYAAVIANRFAGSKAFPNGFGITFHPHRLAEPYGWREPEMVFVASMGDLYHDGVPDEYLARMFKVMAETPQHTYISLTKRHARMRSAMTSSGFRDRVTKMVGHEVPWPLPNLWQGVSIENQKWANIRVPYLMRTPAAVRLVSVEPMLGPVNLREAMVTLGDERGHGLTMSFVHWDCCETLHGLDWVIAGGESGQSARPPHPDWFRALRDECTATDTRYFFKQWGTFAPEEMDRWVDAEGRPRGSRTLVDPLGQRWNQMEALAPEGSVHMRRVTKARSGAELDGRTWRQMPAGLPDALVPKDEMADAE